MEVQTYTEKSLSKSTLSNLKIKKEDYSPRKVSRSLRIKSIKSSLELQKKGEIISFGKLIKANSEGLVKSIIAIWLIFLNQFIYGNDASKALTEHQIEHIADLLIDEPFFRNINIADMDLIFKKAYKGDFGKIYGRLSPPVIIEWFKIYFDERCNVAANMSIKQHQESKGFLSNAQRGCDNMESERNSFHEAQVWNILNKNKIGTEKPPPK